MNRREFLGATAAALAAQGLLPLLTAEAKRPRRRGGVRLVAPTGPRNIFTEPPAIEPVTKYLRSFRPVPSGAMSGSFDAKYALVQCYGSQNDRSINNITGSIQVAFAGGTCETLEERKGRPRTNTVKTNLKCRGEHNTTVKWTLDSSCGESGSLHFVEEGSWDGKAMVVKSKSWTQHRKTANPLIGRWALLGVLASGKLKAKPLRFDMLDDSALRPDQFLRYTGQVKIPVSGGTAKLDCYAQTGRAVVPTHYLVDPQGRVQLITQDSVNWALSELKGS